MERRRKHDKYKMVEKGSLIKILRKNVLPKIKCKFHKVRYTRRKNNINNKKGWTGIGYGIIQAKPWSKSRLIK